MSDGTQVGSAYIEITPKLRMQRAQADIKKHLNDMGREIDREFNKQQREIVGGFNKSMKQFQKGMTKGLFADQRAEMTAFQKLQKQRDSAMKDQLRAFDAEKKKIAESMKAQKSLADQRQATLEAMGKAEGQAHAMERKRIEGIQKAESEAYALERKRIEGIQKAEVQAYIEKDKLWKAEQRDQQRRLAELSQWYDKKKAIEDKDRAEAARASQQFISDQKKRDAYLRARSLGMSPDHSAQYATGQRALGNNRPSQVAGQMARMAPIARSTGTVISRAMDGASHSMSQLSTRIGLASFQLQLLGGFATTFLTGPAAYGMFAMARDGLKFAVSIDYARASMESLLGPSANVEKVLADIRKMAIESPLFNTEDAISYAQKLAAVGVKGTDLYKSMQALSNIFLTQGVAGPERANLALMAYTQILSKGAIGMDDLRQQFAEHVPGGIKIFEQAARVLGFKSIEALNKSMKAGETTAVELNEAFIKLGSSDKYLEGANKAAETLGGTWQAFREEMQATLGMAFDANRKGIIAAINGIRPVVMAFINWLVASLPAMIDWLNRLVVKVREIKAAYDALSPVQKELIQKLILATLVAGPAAIAFGILGTAISGVYNAASLTLKTLALLGGAGAMFFTWTALAATALLAAGAAMAYFYDKSEAVRKAVQQVFNKIKDYIATVFLPVVDLLIGSFQSLEHTFSFLGLKTEHFAYVLGLLVIPIAALTVGLLALVVVVKIVQAAFLVLSSVLYALLHTVSYLMYGVQQLFQALSHLPGEAGRKYEGLAESIEGARHKMEGAIDVQQQWKGLTEANSGATEGLQNKLGAMDLTVDGLSGAFGGWNTATGVAISKQITLAEAVNNARTAMQKQNSEAKSAMDASDTWNTSLLTLKESLKQNGVTLDEKTRKGQANREAMKRATEASYEMMLQDIKAKVPMEEAIRRHKERTDKLRSEFGQSKKTRGQAQELVNTYGRVPKDVHTLVKIMGYKGVEDALFQLLSQQRAGQNGTSPSQELAKLKRQSRKDYDSGIGGLATGGPAAGLVRGQGGPTQDKILAKLSRREYVLNAKATNGIGVDALNYMNKYGQLPLHPQFAKGGSVANWPFPINVSKFKIPELVGGPSGGGGIGVAKMMAFLRQRFPGLALLSGFRKNAITSTGNKSYHGMGRAVDVPPRMDVFNYISSKKGRGTKELIYTPAGNRQIKNGKNHRFTGGTIERDHYDHVHWAYDNGGYIKPNTPFINKTGGNELALNPSQAGALESKIENSDKPVYVSVFVDGVRRDAEIVFDEKIDGMIQAMGGA